MSHHEFTTFTSSEVRRISRVSGDQQRNFRRSGYIPKGDGGWTKFGLMDLAELTIIGFQLERKIPPSVASKIARKIAPMVCAHAIRDKGAIVGGDSALRDGLRNKLLTKFAPHGVRRYAVVTGLTQVTYADSVGETLAVFNEKGGAIVLDLMFYGLLISSGAERPLVTATARGKDEAA